MLAKIDVAMLQVLSNTWALLLGMFLLMIGNGLQGTLLGAWRNRRIFQFGNVDCHVGLFCCSGRQPRGA